AARRIYSVNPAIAFVSVAIVVVAILTGLRDVAAETKPAFCGPLAWQLCGFRCGIVAPTRQLFLHGLDVLRRPALLLRVRQGPLNVLSRLTRQYDLVLFHTLRKLRVTLNERIFECPGTRLW